MFPQPDDAPTAPSQHDPDTAVSFSVSGNFRIPKAKPGLWHPTVPAAAMPETPINKNCEACFAENEVRTAREWLVSAPAFYPGGAEDRGQLKLSGFVPFGANGCHLQGPLFLSDRVGHGE